MKRLFKLLPVPVMIAASGAVCSAEESVPKTEILRDRVIGVTYDTYDFDANAAYLNKCDMLAEVGGCSCVKVLLDGKVYVGRNYDFYCSDSPAFVVRNNAGKYRTIGIGNSPQSLPAWSEDYEIPERVLNALPFLCSDVLSEAGIHCEGNMREFEEQLACRSTNPGKPRRCTQTFMVTMLSAYGTIDEILAHIDDYDWFGLETQGFEQSFFLTDKTGRSVLIEFAADSWTATDTDYNVNFYQNPDYYALEKYPIGEIRRDRELALKAGIKTPADIFTMMEAGSYARFYRADCDVDYAIGENLKNLGYTRFNIEEHRAEARVRMQEMLNKYGTYTREEQVENKCWESVFIHVVNVTDLTFDVHFSEHYGIRFTVAFE